MTILAVIQARVGSSRLPGKVLMPIMGKSMLERQLERVNLCRRIDGIVVATSDGPEDEEIVAVCDDAGVEIFRGDLHDVLDRFYRAAKKYAPDHVVRLTGDCPLIDPALIDRLIDFYLSEPCDYASNCEAPTMPDGLDAEVMSFEALERAWQEATASSEREHVTPYIRSHPEKFKTRCYQYHKDLSHMRWTVDEPQDLEFVRQVYQRLYPSKPDFSFQDVLELLEDEPALCRINEGFRRNEGYERSLNNDRTGK
jgi:spore coat polysaccharide biosynthesis protein SpsF